METITVFEDISQHIIQQLKQAEIAITICVAWLTDEEILVTLVNQARKGVFIEIITINDEFNRAKSSFFNQLISLDCKVYMIDKTIEHGMLHHKFCVIDRDVLITGSYNWSNNARNNSENILINVTNDPEDLWIIYDYEREFNNLLYKHGIKNKKEVLESVENYQTNQNMLQAKSNELYECSLDYYYKEQDEAALEFINEAISIYKDQSYYLLRHLIHIGNGRYLECTNDLFLYMGHIPIGDEKELNRFKKHYNDFIANVKDGLNTYKFINEINQKTKVYLGVFARLDIEPHFFTFEELNPYPF